MNKIYKVMYSKVKQCAVVVSEIAKSHGHNEGRSAVRKHTALTAAVLIALGTFTFMGTPAAQAGDSLKNNDFVGANSTYWYWDIKKNTWTTYDYKLGDAFNNRSWTDLPNYNGAGAKLPGSIAAGLYAQAGQETITIGDRNAGQSRGSVFIGEQGKYNDGGDNNPSEKSMQNNYVTAVGFQSDATGWGSIAIGSNAVAENTKKTDTTVNEVGKIGNPKTVSDDVYGIESNPSIKGASVALGYNAHAKDGNIAIGAYSDATDTTTSTTPYVSVGNSNLKRRITNVADGDAATDVATVGQLQDLEKKTIAYNEGWGIKIGDYTKKDAAGNETTVKNAISVDRNLGNNSTSVTQVSNTGLILGGDFRPDERYGNYGATGQYAVTLGGRSNRASGESSVAAGGMDNTADGNQAFVGGGYRNIASGDRSSAIGGVQNTASGPLSSAIGGDQNTASGDYSSAIAGYQNTANGFQSSAIGGWRNIASGWQSSAFGGSDNISLGMRSSTLGGTNSVVLGNFATGIAGGSTGSSADNSLAAGSNSVVTVDNGIAIGYQATTNERGTIAFGHDKDDISGYTVTWKQKATSTGGKYYNAKGVEITKDQYEALRNPDYTFNDYSKDPEINEDKYKTAAYNRLVKVADGKDDHDVVVMEQLKNASNVGNNIKVYKTDENGNVQFDENNKPIEDTSDAAKTAQNGSKDDWGQALGAGTFTTGTDTTPTNASISDQLVTGKTLYDYDKPTGSQNYVNVNNTTGQNLSALDAQVKANAVTLNDKTHNIKYYSVEDKISDDKLLPSISGYSNEKNDGAKGAGSMAAGFNTHADGIASTVAGSYSGVVGTGLQGATALSYGTFNINQNTDATKAHSGVANSIIGQANATTDSNAAIIYGAGNTVTNSYRAIDTSKFNLGKVEQDIARKDAAAVAKDLQQAVPTSGGQVMVMGGGNSVEKAYMTQVTGVGNTVTGSGTEYGTDSTQLNYIEGFYTKLENGKNDYIIGAHNTVTGDTTAQNQSNIVFGDNHKLTNTKNNLILGSSDTADDETTVSDVVSIGHNAKVTKEGGVAIGSGSEATTAAGVAGYDPTGATADTTAAWTSKKAAVSVGTADETRQITGVAAGKEETDAVNVAQLKKLNGMKANVNADNIGKNLNHKADGTAVTDEDKTANENDWGSAIGTGSIAADNGQLVTGKTVYAYNKPVAAEGKTLNYVSDTKTTGQNLGSLDAQVGTNTGDISNLKNLSNISSAGETVIKNLAKGSIGMEDGSHTTASHRDVNGVDTYKVDVTVDGQVTENNKGIVDGGTVYNAIQDVKTKTSADLANKANVDASNLSDENVKSWQEKLGNGEVVFGNKGLVTGDTVFKAVDTKANRDGSNLTTDEADKFSEKIAVGKVEANDKRAVSGETVSKAISDLTGDMNTKLDGKANTSLDNITDTGKNVIRDLAKGSVKVIDGTNTTVTTVEGKGETPTTYAVNVEGNGTIASGNTGLISGGTLYNEVHVDKDGTYIKSKDSATGKDMTVAQNLSALDTGLKTTSDLIHTNDKGDIQIGGSSKATKIDVHGKDAKGNTTGRFITGVVTDAGDNTSAANVGYVNGVTAANTQQIYRDMNNAYGRLNNNINKAAAGSNALAALHPLDYDPDDKADFAVGYGHYRNANAAAVGAFYHPNENTMVNVGVSLGNGDPGFNAGVSFKIGSGSAGREAMSKTEMAKVINSQSKEIDALKKDNADKDKRIDALEQKMAEILAKLDKNGK